MHLSMLFIFRRNRAVEIFPVLKGRSPTLFLSLASKMAAKGAFLHHIARETADVKRLAKFYQEILGFERIESPYFGEMEVIWLRVPNTALSMHLIERNPQSKLPESPWTSTAPIADPRNLPRGHHLCFGVSNYDSLLQTLKEKGIETFEKTQPDGKTKQAFFFDPDGNGLEAGNWEPPQQ